jgi:two-component system, sporulation sensor kinase B
MDTIDGIKQILLQVFLILFPILLYHLYWGENDLQEDKRKSRFAYGLLSTISIILCMLFKVSVYDGYILDLRAVPLLLAFLYGGYVSGLFVTAVLLGYRYFLGGGGLFIPFLTCSFLVLLFQLIIPRYNRCSSGNRVFFATIIALCTSLFISTTTFIKLIWSGIQINARALELFIGYSIIQIITMWVAVALIESLREKVMMQYQLRRSDQLHIMSELAASVAHEIRNPLTVVRGFMQLFNENKQMPEGVKPYIALMITEIDRTQEIIIDFLSIAKPKLERLETISVAEHIQHIINLMYSYATLQNVNLKMSVTDFPYIQTDPDKFSQVLINIIKNGIEAMPNGGQLEISINEVNGMAEISINDQGVGMTEKEVKRLGTPFYSTKTKGTGIGMMVSFRLVEKMNGQIKIRSKKGSGTEFIIKIPKIIEKGN